LNIFSYTRAALLDPTIINLTGGKTVHLGHATLPVTPYIEYELYDEDGALWAEGEEKATNFYLQVSIFSKGDYTALEEAVKDKLLSVGFERIGAAYLWEPAPVELHHRPIRFVYTSNTV